MMVAARARSALAGSGFALVPELFEPEDLAVVRRLIGELQERVEVQVLAGRSLPFAKAQLFDTDDGGDPALDHLEILYPASLFPDLLETRVFRRSRDLAAALAGPCSLSFDSMIVKPPRNRSATLWHRDGDFSPMRFLPSAFHSRLHMWIPLSGASAANGTMKYVAGSHCEPRRLNVPNESIVTCAVPEGGMTIHSSQTLHASDPNRSDLARTAWLLTFSRFGSAKRRIQRLLGRIPGEAAVH